MRTEHNIEVLHEDVLYNCVVFINWYEDETDNEVKYNAIDYYELWDCINLDTNERIELDNDVIPSLKEAISWAIQNGKY